MRFTPGILTSLLEPVDRRRFKALVHKHSGDAYGKSFNNWEHLVALIFSELLRQLVGGLGRKARHEARDCLQLIDSTPIPLSQLFDCSAFMICSAHVR